jgi:proteasome lid subunit RPN8/RPN11
MIQERHQFALELERRDKSPLGQFPVSMDWEPARQWARLVALRAGQQPGLKASIEPQWEATVGKPYVDGVCMRLAGGSVVIPLSYFRTAAQQIGQKLVAEKRLTDGELFTYGVVAFPVQNDTPRPLFRVEEVEATLPLKPARLPAAVEFGTQFPGDLPVVVPQTVLDEAAALTRQAEANEIGGILIGHVCTDDERRDLFVEVTALIPARHALSASTKLTFTAETWTAVDAAIKLRRREEQMLAWFHSHPSKYWCGPNCSLEARKKCPLSRNFFSAEDCLLHRTVFPMAHCFALVATNTDAGLNFAMFGWRQGLIAQRGFHILNATNNAGEPAEAVIGGTHEETCN